MAGVYGSFYECFPELQERFDVWTNPDKSDIRSIVAIFMPNQGSVIKRRKYTSGNTALDIQDSDELYVSIAFGKRIREGDYIQGNDGILRRLTGLVPYDKAAGYRIYTVERVTGATAEKTEELKVKEARFA